MSEISNEQFKKSFLHFLQGPGGPLSDKLQQRIDQLEAAMELIADDNAIFIHRKDSQIVVGVSLNDTFSYATAECKEVPWDQVEYLLDLRKREGWPGLIRWASDQKWNPLPEAQELMNKWDQLRKERDEAKERVEYLQGVLYDYVNLEK